MGHFQDRDVPHRRVPKRLVNGRWVPMDFRGTSADVYLRTECRTCGWNAILRLTTTCENCGTPMKKIVKKAIKQAIKQKFKMLKVEVSPCASCGGEAYTDSDFCYGCDNVICLKCMTDEDHNGWGAKHGLKKQVKTKPAKNIVVPKPAKKKR